MPDRAKPLVVLLPGLDGTTQLFGRFLAASDGSVEFRAIPYPHDVFLGYPDLESMVRRLLPTDRPFVLLGESFSGPLALRVAAYPPPELAGVILATTFLNRPASQPIAVLSPLAPAFFRLPLPRHVVRLLLAGGGAPSDIVEEVRAAVATVHGEVMAGRAMEALRMDARQEFLDCPVPLMALCGRWDRLIRRSVPRQLRELRPDCEVHVLDAPHLVLQLQPTLSMQLIERFVQRALAARTWQGRAMPPPAKPSLVGEATTRT